MGALIRSAIFSTKTVILPGPAFMSLSKAVGRRYGILLMLLSIALFSAGDAVGKILVTDYPVAQFLLLRGVVSLVLLAPFMWRVGRDAFIRMQRPGIQVLRMLLSVGDIGLFFLAVVYLPLADVITFYLAVPVYVTALSALVLREKVGWQRGLAVAAGFVGVLIALQPSPATLTWPALVALAGSMCFAALMMLTRVVRGTPDVVLTATHLAGTTLFGAVLTSFHFVVPDQRAALLYFLGGLLSVGAVLCLNRSLKLASAGVVAPYQYTMILWAIALGYAVFGDVPSVPMLIGCAIIVAAGLYIFLHERAAETRPAAETVSPPP